METQLRLADRRGLLQGPSLSPVQAYAAELLLILDQRRSVDRQVFEHRSRLAASNPEFASKIFPEWFPDSKDDEKQQEEKTEPKDSELEWSIPTSDDEVDALDEWVREHTQMTVTSAEMQEWQ